MKKRTESKTRFSPTVLWARLYLCASGMLLLMTMFTGCTQEDDNRLSDDKRPMTFTATMEGQAVAKSTTRATSDGSWTGDEEVAVQIAGNAIVKKYTADKAGKLTSTQPYYWQKTTETKNVSTWVPYSDTKPTSFDVCADQSGDDYQHSDMLWSTGTIVYSAPELIFKHLPAKVVVNLKTGDGVAAADIASAIVTLMGQHLTSGAIDAANWDVTQQSTAGNQTITSNALATPTATYQKTVQALVVPQATGAASRFIKVTVAGADYYYTGTQNFAAGKQYPYNITVSKNGLTVTASSATNWTGTETSVTGKELSKGFAASDLKVGDYYYSDGEVSDGGYRRYTDNTTATHPILPVLKSADGSSRSVLGIVLKVGKEDKGDWIDDCSYKLKDGATDMSTIRGYVLAIDETATSVKWGKADAISEVTDEKAIGFYGYKYTQTIIGKGTDLSTDYPATYHATTGYEDLHTAPTSSSGWFLPSVGQCQYWLDNKDVLLASIRTAIGQSDYKWNLDYWSSSISIEGKASAWAWTTTHASLAPQMLSTGRDMGNKVRPILAF